MQLISFSMVSEGKLVLATWIDIGVYNKILDSIQVHLRYGKEYQSDLTSIWKEKISLSVRGMLTVLIYICKFNIADYEKKPIYSTLSKV